MQLKSTSFDAKVKDIAVKAKGAEVKLAVSGIDGALLQELAGMMALGTVEVTLAAKVEQRALAFGEDARHRDIEVDEQPAVAEAGAQTRPAFF